MRLNKMDCIALDVVTMVGSKPRRVAELAAELDTSEPFLQQICMKLRRAGLLESTRGPGGGIIAPQGKFSASACQILEAVGTRMVWRPGSEYSSDGVQTQLYCNLTKMEISYDSYHKTQAAEALLLSV